MIFFLDASALIKLYREETGSSALHALLVRPDPKPSLFISDMVALEVLVHLVKQGRSEDRKERRSARVALAAYADDRVNRLNTFDTEPRMVRDAEAAALRYRDSGAGTLDLLHAASALRLRLRAPDQPFVFVVADRKLRHLAERIGLRTLDPEAEDAGA